MHVHLRVVKSSENLLFLCLITFDNLQYIVNIIEIINTTTQCMNLKRIAVYLCNTGHFVRIARRIYTVICNNT